MGKKIKTKSVAIGLAVALIAAGLSVPAPAAALTEVQIQAILNLLRAFGVDAAVISNVHNALRGKQIATTAPQPVLRGVFSEIENSLSKLFQMETELASKSFLRLNLNPQAGEIPEINTSSLGKTISEMNNLSVAISKISGSPDTIADGVDKLLSGSGIDLKVFDVSLFGGQETTEAIDLGKIPEGLPLVEFDDFEELFARSAEIDSLFWKLDGNFRTLRQYTSAGSKNRELVDQALAVIQNYHGLFPNPFRVAAVNSVSKALKKSLLP